VTPQQPITKLCNQTFATSPWTEAYRAMSSRAAQQTASKPQMPERPYDHEAQAPTHDALSAIYNRGY
jgi:hypothetical protein